MRIFGSGRTRWSVVMLSVSLLVWASMGTTALGAAEKSFSATLAPEPLVAGATYGTVDRAGIVLTITNTSTQASLGSANVTVPAGLILTSAAVAPPSAATPSGNQVELRDLDLAPGESAVVTIGARVECGANHASYTWGFLTKQANDFNGTPGNDLVQAAPVTSTIEGICGLTFSAGPASSEKSTAITNKVYDPAGAPVTVSIVDAQGTQPVSWWNGSVSLALATHPTADTAVLSGTVSGSTTTGSVAFAPQIDTSATGYTLVATAVGAVGTPSAGTTSAGLVSVPFNIVDDATICLNAASTCMVSASGPSRGSQGVKTRATVTASAGGRSGDLVILSVADPAQEFNCGAYVATTDVIFFNVTLENGTTGTTPLDNRTKTTQMTLLAPYVTKSAAKYEACYKADRPFKTASGATALVGLLPTCARQNPVAPCVVSRSTTKTKDVILTILSPAGDPGLKF